MLDDADALEQPPQRAWHCAWQTDDALVDIDRALEDFGVGFGFASTEGAG